jgi:hypothetical protein
LAIPAFAGRSGSGLLAPAASAFLLIALLGALPFLTGRGLIGRGRRAGSGGL